MKNITWRAITWQQIGAAHVLRAYLDHCRRKCQETIEVLTDQKADQLCKFPWCEEVSFAELQLYSMRHVQEHASQLSLLLGQKVGSAPDWVPRAESRAA
jgi:DinB superfamily